MDEDADEERLARAAATGDREAFAELLDRRYDRIFRLAWRLLGDAAEAEDLTQEICLGLADKIRGFRGESRFSTWLYRLIVNAARDAQRKHMRQNAVLDGFAEVESMRRADDVARAAEAAWLKGALSALKPDLRETAVLVLDEGLSHREAAEILNLREATVSWRMSEIRKALQELSAREACDETGRGARCDQGLTA